MLWVKFRHRAGRLEGIRRTSTVRSPTRRGRAAALRPGRRGRPRARGGATPDASATLGRPGRCSAGCPTSRRWSAPISCCWRASSGWARSSISAGSGAASSGGVHGRGRRRPWSRPSSSLSVCSRVSSRSSSAADQAERPVGGPGRCSAAQRRARAASRQASARGCTSARHDRVAASDALHVGAHQLPVQPAVDRRQPGGTVPGLDVAASPAAPGRSPARASAAPRRPGTRRRPAPRRPAAGRAPAGRRAAPGDGPGWPC